MKKILVLLIILSFNFQIYSQSNNYFINENLLMLPKYLKINNFSKIVITEVKDNGVDSRKLTYSFNKSGEINKLEVYNLEYNVLDEYFDYIWSKDKKYIEEIWKFPNVDSSTILRYYYNDDWKVIKRFQLDDNHKEINQSEMDYFYDKNKKLFKMILICDNSILNFIYDDSNNITQYKLQDKSNNETVINLIYQKDNNNNKIISINNEEKKYTILYNEKGDFDEIKEFWGNALIRIYKYEYFK